jgi:hypothetical protein
MTKKIKEWISKGGECLNIWLENGIEHPSEYAIEIMQIWIRQSKEAGWTELYETGQLILNESISMEEKTEVFMRLCSLYENIRIIYEKMILK